MKDYDVTTTRKMKRMVVRDITGSKREDENNGDKLSRRAEGEGETRIIHTRKY